MNIRQMKYLFFQKLSQNSTKYLRKNQQKMHILISSKKGQKH